MPTRMALIGTPSGVFLLGLSGNAGRSGWGLLRHIRRNGLQVRQQPLMRRETKSAALLVESDKSYFLDQTFCHTDVSFRLTEDRWEGQVEA